MPSTWHFFEELQTSECRPCQIQNPFDRQTYRAESFYPFHPRTHPAAQRSPFNPFESLSRKREIFTNISRNYKAGLHRECFSIACQESWHAAFLRSSSVVFSLPKLSLCVRVSTCVEMKFLQPFFATYITLIFLTMKFQLFLFRLSTFWTVDRTTRNERPCVR